MASHIYAIYMGRQLVLCDRPFYQYTKYDIIGGPYKNAQVHGGQQGHPSVSTYPDEDDAAAVADDDAQVHGGQQRHTSMSTYPERAPRPSWTLHKDNPRLPVLLCKGETVGPVLAFDLFSRIEKLFLMLILWTILVDYFLCHLQRLKCYVSLLLFSHCIVSVQNVSKAPCGVSLVAGGDAGS